MVDSRKIKSRLVALGLTQKDVATALNIAQPTANQKLNNKRAMRLEEAEKLIKLLKLDLSDFGEYFFVNKVA